MQLRVRCLSGAELTLEIPPLTVRIRVAEIKRHVLTELLRLRSLPEAKLTPLEAAQGLTKSSESTTVERMMGHTWLAFRGQLLADADDVHLFALVETDFFVLVEEDDEVEDDEEEDEVTEEEESKQEPRQRKMRKTAAVRCRDSDEAVALQLVEMGFQAEQATAATESSGGDLQRAVALLMGEADDASRLDRYQDHQLRDFVTELLRQYPELIAIESLLMNEQVHALKKASNSQLDALVMLKEKFPMHWLEQMNENPAATVLFFAVPEQFERWRAQRATGTSRMTTTPAVEEETKEIDLTTDDSPAVHTADQEAIDRVRTGVCCGLVQLGDANILFYVWGL